MFFPRIIFFPRFFAHESHESTRIVCNEYNGDLFGRTNLTNVCEAEIIECNDWISENSCDRTGRH